MSNEIQGASATDVTELRAAWDANVAQLSEPGEAAELASVPVDAKTDAGDSEGLAAAARQERAQQAHVDAARRLPSQDLGPGQRPCARCGDPLPASSSKSRKYCDPCGVEVRVEQTARHSRAATVARQQLRATIQTLRSALVDKGPEFQEGETELFERPRTRRDCLTAEQAGDGLGNGINSARPCPWISCRYHLFADVNPDTGTITYHHPEKEPWELTETCALDVADAGESTLIEIGRLFNTSKEGTRQTETKAINKLAKRERLRRANGQDDGE